MARPTLYSEQFVETFIERIATRSMVSVCEDDDMPSVSSVCLWLTKYPEFSDRYARALEARADFFAEETFAIADDGRNDWMERLGEGGQPVGWQVNGEAVARSKLRLDQRKWAAGQMKPSRWGAKQQIEHSGSLTLVQASTEDLVEELRALMATGHIPKAPFAVAVDDEPVPGADLV